MAEGLLVPVVHNTDVKSLLQIANENKENIQLAKIGKLTGTAQGGGTITLSNLGSFGVKSFTAIINQSESAIFAVGAINEKVVVYKGTIAARPIMNLTATFDHRLIDGAYGASFVKDLQELLETPGIGLLYEVDKL